MSPVARTGHVAPADEPAGDHVAPGTRSAAPTDPLDVR